MKKLFFYLLIIIVLFFAVISIKTHRHKEVQVYRSALTRNVGKDSFYLKDVTDFEWDRALAFAFPASREDLENASGVKIDFNYDVSEGIIFISKGKIVFKDISAMDPERPSPIEYELNDKHFSVYKRDALICAREKDNGVVISLSK